MLIIFVYTPSIAVVFSFTKDFNILTLSPFQSNGEIKAKVSLDREAKDTYTVEITARDNGKPSLSKSTLYSKRSEIKEVLFAV